MRSGVSAPVSGRRIRMTTIVLILASISAAVVVGAFLFSTPFAILLAYLTKPVIDASWASSLFGINALKVVGVLVPVFVLGRYFTARNRPRIPLVTIWLVYVFYGACSFTFQIVFASDSFDANLVNIADSTFRVLNGFAGYLMVQCYFTDKEQFRRLLVFLLLAGMFPLFIGVFQAASGVTWQERQTVGLTRNVGLYHDAFAVRTFVFQTLAAIFLYWSYFLDRGRSTKRLLFVGLSALCFIVLYKTYSKAGVLVLLAWLIIWSIGTRKLLPVLSVVLLVVAVNLATDDQITLEIRQLFSKEVIATGEGADGRAEKRTLAGRWYIWGQYWEGYVRSSIIEQLFGNGRSIPAHNDFLARLITNGLIGLVIYCILLWSTGAALVRNYLRDRSPLNVMGLMLFAMWLIDAIGLVPSMYTSYQWFVWGLIGLALHGVAWELGKPPKLRSSSPPQDINN